MPIFMDLHIIPGVKAKDVAEAHQHDLLIQNEYNCTCMTYWIDESRDSVFCLIEAPNAQAVKDLHNKSHGLAPHKIIAVNKTIVESFLGRIYDPHVEGLKEGQLKIFNDPAFRILMLVDIYNPVLLKKQLGKEAKDLIKKYRQSLQQFSGENEGEKVNHNENINAILSFTSANKALSCAIAIKNNFSAEERALLHLKISLNAGVPVTKNRRLFGDTIDFGKTLTFISNPEKIMVASVIPKLVDQKFLKKFRNAIGRLTSSEEKTLGHLITLLEKNIGNENFGVEQLCKQLAMSKSGLNRTSQALTGKTPNSLIKEYRLARALELLGEKNLPVSQVAFTTGFTSPSYFSKCFREFYGIPPSFLLDQQK